MLYSAKYLYLRVRPTSMHVTVLVRYKLCEACSSHSAAHFSLPRLHAGRGRAAVVFYAVVRLVSMKSMRTPKSPAGRAAFVVGFF